MAKAKNVLMVSVPMPSYIQNYLKDTLRLTGFEAINVYRSFIEEYLNDSFGATNDDFLSWIKASEYAHLTKDNN
jgi:hypothetical protein